MDVPKLGYLMLAWLVYFAFHSALASHTAKRYLAARFPHLIRHYRLAYNMLALALLLVPLWLLKGDQAEPLWHWSGLWRPIMDGVGLAAVIGFVWSLRYYDVGDFLGVGKARHPGPPRLILSPFHRYVRHPWYSLGLVIIWTRDMEPAWLVSCVAITLYVVIGSRWEEQKLVAEFGEVYRGYRQRVPRLVPVPGRRLTEAAAAEIVEKRDQA